jgi:hypothetical protein
VQRLCATGTQRRLAPKQVRIIRRRRVKSGPNAITSAGRGEFKRHLLLYVVGVVVLLDDHVLTDRRARVYVSARAPAAVFRSARVGISLPGDISRDDSPTCTSRRLTKASAAPPETGWTVSGFPYL